MRPKPRVLIAEDELDMRNLVGFAMRGQPFSVTIVEDGGQALDQYRLSKEAGIPYDLIVLDMMMTPISGLAVAEKIRAEGDLDTKLVLWTAGDSPLVQMRVAGAGISDVWPKVEEPLVFAARISGVLGLTDPSTCRE